MRMFWAHQSSKAVAEPLSWCAFKHLVLVAQLRDQALEVLCCRCVVHLQPAAPELQHPLCHGLVFLMLGGEPP